MLSAPSLSTKLEQPQRMERSGSFGLVAGGSLHPPIYRWQRRGSFRKSCEPKNCPTTHSRCVGADMGEGGGIVNPSDARTAPMSPITSMEEAGLFAVVFMTWLRLSGKSVQSSTAHHKPPQSEVAHTLLTPVNKPKISRVQIILTPHWSLYTRHW